MIPSSIKYFGTSDMNVLKTFITLLLEDGMLWSNMGTVWSIGYEVQTICHPKYNPCPDKTHAHYHYTNLIPYFL